MSEITNPGTELWKCARADCLFNAGLVFPCLGLIGQPRPAEFQLFVAAVMAGFCLLKGIRDSAAALLGGVDVNAEGDPRPSLATSIGVLTVWIGGFIGLSLNLSVLEFPLWGRGVLLLGAAFMMMFAARALQWSPSDRMAPARRTPRASDRQSPG